MIIGIGTDIAAIDRIERILNRYEDAFLRKVFTSAEIEYCSAKARPAIHFAGRWSAKEAFYKALSHGMQQHSFWKSIEITPATQGRHPRIRVISESLKTALSRAGVSDIHLSISHESHFSVAFVVLESASGQ